MLIDTHAHIDCIYYFRDREKLLDKCFQSGMNAIINIGTDYKSSIESVNLANKYPGIYASVGIHPLAVDEIDDSIISSIGDFTHDRKVVAIGEIGLDYSGENCNKDLQKKWFEKQLLLAKKFNLPVIIHSIKSSEDILDVLDCVGLLDRGGVAHFFNDDWEVAKKYISRGLYISIAGNITLEDQNKKIIEVVRKIDLNKLLVETDSPFHAPFPVNKKRNNPLNIRYIIKKIADIRNIEYDELCKIIAMNAKNIFRLEDIKC